MVDTAHEPVRVQLRWEPLFWIAFALCVIGLGFPAYTGITIFLILLSGTILGSIWSALRARRVVVLGVGTVLVATTKLLLGIVTDQLGWLTFPLLILAF